MSTPGRLLLARACLDRRETASAKITIYLPHGVEVNDVWQQHTFVEGIVFGDVK